MARDINEHDGIFSWSIYSKYQIAFSRHVKESDLIYLNNFDKFTSFYLDLADIDILSKQYKITKSRDDDIIIPIENFSLKGNKYIKIRTCINNNQKRNFTIENNYRDYNDVLEFLKRWDDTCGERHFQSRTGKNKYFFKHNFHLEGISVFIYDANKLIAFGVLSCPVDGKSAYVIGKALSLDYKGLSEYCDVLLYEKARLLNVKEVNLGGGDKGVVFYKMKFPNAYRRESYDIKAMRI